jgi:hypothetical protein
MQRNGFRTLCRLGCLLAVGALLAAPSMAQPIINPGVDLFETPADGRTTAVVSIPAGFFCPGSAPFAGSVPLRGVPLATTPPGIAGNADTIVERLTGGTTTFSVVLRALRLTSINPIQIFCPGEGLTSWQVDACACGPQAASNITVRIDPVCGTCGTANGILSVRVCLRFTRVDTGLTMGPITQAITLGLANMSWCYQPGPGEIEVTQSFAVDTNCDNLPDRTLPPTSNFHPGWSCQGGGSEVHCHPTHPPSDKLHCITPVPRP